METTIRVDQGPLTFKHLILLVIALATGKPKDAPQGPPLRSNRPHRDHSPASPDAAARGLHAATPTEIPARGWKEVLLRTWKEAGDDNVGLVSAGVAFYAFLALVPLLGAVVLTYGLFASPAGVARSMARLTTLLPQEVAQIIGQQLTQVVQTSGGKKGIGLLVALALAIFGARSAVGGIITSLNIAYEEQEKRGFLFVNLLAIGMTAAMVVLIVLALGAATGMALLDEALPHLPGVVTALLKLLSYAILAIIAAATAATLYRYGPSRDEAKWRWITPGTLLFALAWVVLTAGFGFYAANLGHYGATYGSLAGVVVLLTWTYLS
ncbi:MAG TPA: YihY/virulence factor BrkB family protein, partial [Novosphingobium sp.]|nr:YihY/virulence factor BrkB family protein [Novosphingobium sp.]